ncbi:MAG: YbaK/EbsC family protein [Ardenticatenia bacterium]|nr:YbaK/EbsC family protein [Ardenticatenia bacterium]
MAARAIGCRPEQVIKSVLFLVKRGTAREPVLVLVAGTAKIAYSALGRLFGVGRKKVRMATPDEVMQFTGYPVGGVPPFGHPTPCPPTPTDPCWPKRCSTPAEAMTAPC